ncbi:MAG TPA: glutathione S-transferase family protein [Stellaceae bacterium]|nr:glutathione S-transferase family protein [Stellaceae bacterium]
MRSRASRCLWLLEELGLPYELEKVDQAAGENRTPAYLALNPAGKVPTLTDGDFVMSESHAILLWLAQSAGAPFWPEDRQAQGRALQWTVWTAAELEPVTTSIVHGLRDTTPGAADRLAAARATAADRLRLVELQLAKTRYIAGAGMTVADVSLGSNVAYAEFFGLDLGTLPHLRAWRDGLKQRPAYQRVFGAA